MKRVGSKRYLHRSALHELNKRDKNRVESVARKVKGFRWSVVRLDGAEIMLGRTTSFDTEDHPALLESYRFRSGKQVDHRTYSNPPIYHRVELMLPQSHPARRKAERTTRREEKAGLLGRPDIGTRRAWQRAKGSHNMGPITADPTYYASGTNSPAYMNAYLQEGHPIGISMENCQEKCLGWIWEHAHDPRLRLFVDSGAFHEYTKKKPITDSQWKSRLQAMAKIGKKVGDRALIVLPDKVADPDESFNRMVKYGKLVKKIIDTDAHVIVPIQLGRQAAEYIAGVGSVLNTDPQRFVLGMPMKASPLTAEQVGKIAHDLAPNQIHLLGLGPESKRFGPTISAIRSQSPFTAISSDSVFTRRVAGKARGPLTRRRYQALFDVGFGDPQSQMPDLTMMAQDPEIWVQVVTNPNSSPANRRKQAEKKLAELLKGVMGKRKAQKLAKDYLDGKSTILTGEDTDGEWAADEGGLADYAAWLWQIIEAQTVRQSKRGGIGPGASSARSSQASRLGTRRTLSGQLSDMDKELNEQFAKGEIIVPKQGVWNMARLEFVVGREVTKRIPEINTYGAGQAMRRVLYDPKWHRKVGTWGRRGKGAKPVSVSRLLGSVLPIARRAGGDANDPAWLPEQMGLI